MKYQLHKGCMFRLQNAHHQTNAEHIQGTKNNLYSDTSANEDNSFRNHIR